MFKRTANVISSAARKQKNLSKEFHEKKHVNQLRSREIRKDIEHRSEKMEAKRRKDQKDFDLIRNR
ncbi:hypothetical protein [Paraliobacillus ryukyuensis]|uniref:hypothetical protein n=1 Tax=Paraliobacillus ryukyuensis TaxID=200904 RepID=UPI0009A57800|nr:hypothetical protein [Paraliobacillus ryukyuensis]